MPQCGKGLMLFSTVFHLYRGSQCTYPCFPGVLLTSTLHKILSKPLLAFPHNQCRQRQHACRKKRQKGHHFVFSPFLIYHVCLMLLHMYVIFTSRYCFLSKRAQYDPSCRWALKHYSFIHCRQR